MKIMNRRGFLSVVATLAALPFLVAFSGRIKNPKMGKVIIKDDGVVPGDWTVVFKGKPTRPSHIVVAADDIEGWVQYYQTDKDGRKTYPICIAFGDVRMEYRGADPRFSQLKKPTI